MEREHGVGAAERLVTYVYPAAADPLAAELTGWLAESARFRQFVEANRDKIRKKLRSAPDPESRRDVRAELNAARLLLDDRRLTLAFEAYGSGNRGPDFTVTFGGRPFNVEVTRPHRVPLDVARTLLGKLPQFPPSVPNVLVVAVEPDAVGDLDVADAVHGIRARADAKDDGFFTDRGFEGSRGFYERFLRLGAVVVWAERGPEDGRAAVWTNGSARIAVPARALRACVACLGVGVAS